MEYFRRNRGFTIIEILVVITIIAILASMIAGTVLLARKEASKKVAMAMVNSMSTALDQFVADEGFYPGNKIKEEDTNAFPELFNALLGEPRPNGPGGRSAPYVDVKEKDIAVFDEDEERYREAKSAEVLDPNVPKYILDPWGMPYWYRENKSKPPAPYMHRRGKADIWSTGPDKENQTLVGEKGDDIGNW